MKQPLILSTAAVLLVAVGLLGARGFQVSPAASEAYDVILRGGTLYDGSGARPVVTDLAMRGDRIAAIGDLKRATATTEIDARGLAVAPGFINMLSWSNESLIADGRSQSELRQGVTLEVMGEGWSMGPMNEAIKQETLEQQGDIKFPITWTTLGEYLDFLAKKGISTNVASFVGATTVRMHEVGNVDRRPTAEELERMKGLVRQAMEEGALGLASSLIYPPGFFAKEDELVELCRVVSQYGGIYISHIRSEGNQFLESLDELIRIARAARVPAEVYHFKAAGKTNWGKIEPAIGRIEQARKEGLAITADMYTYTAAATGLSASMPPWVQEGGPKAFVARLKEPAVRARVIQEMKTPTDKWENMYLHAGPTGILLVGFKNEALKPLTGKTLAEVAAMRGKSPEETAMDLIVEDDSRIGTVYFLMSEENVRREIKLPWVSFGSDEASQAPEGVFLKSNPHPRAYGTFVRVLGRYARDEKLFPLEEAIRKLSSLPASNLKIRDRGSLKVGHYADVVVFDAARIQDHATYEKPHQYATGMRHVFVNGVQVLKNGEHTGAFPGRVVRGPGYKR